ncbi:MAG: cytochrome c [Aliarcobacter sp.]|jgi:mono/diheme cytochrome c family protein|nr:cytochrome c [Aliarcobacter sp.]
MSVGFKIPLVLIFLFNISNASQVDGEKIFKQYCWGCHHETSVAFGPSFEQIANQRTVAEIQGHIIAPKSMYKQLGHKRSVMPSFQDKLSQEELDAITDFILSYKSKKD